VPAELEPWRRSLEAATASDTAQTRAWRALARRPRWHAFALRRLAALSLARGDSAEAETSLVALAGLRGAWQWPALSDGASLALARRDTAVALRRIERVKPDDWPDDEHAQWLALDATLRAATGDLSGAIDLAHGAIERFPALPATAALLPRWEGWLAAQGRRPDPGELRAAAEVDVFRADRTSAARRLTEALAQLRGDGLAAARAATGLRLGEVLRGARRYGDADRALGRAEHDADPPTLARIALERARVSRDGGKPDLAASRFGRAADLALDPGLRELCFWERARELEQGGEWSKARADYARVVALGRARAPEAALRTGLLWYVEGRADSARAAWARGSTEACAFWSAVSLRRSDPVAADSALGEIAARPGYTFYRAAARDTLGRTGWPPSALPSPAVASGDETLDLARDLVSIGESADAALLVQRWYAGDARLPGTSRTVPRRAGPLLFAARIAYAAGRPSLAIQIARRAVDATPESLSAERWGLVPWAYPPAYDSLITARTAPGTSWPERALLFALIWQESKFDPAARSRSDAIGLMQVRPQIASTMARVRRERPPGAAGLMDPATNLTFGIRLLTELHDAFDGQIALVLAGYNAGPASANRWRDRIRAGGAALQAELFEYAETADYVKSILGVRQAYRELTPHALASAPPAAER
jgi:soluble lytic murein transglycosylase-like protein